VLFRSPGLPGYNPNLLTSWGDRASDPQALHGNLQAATAHMAAYVAAACHGDIKQCPQAFYITGDTLRAKPLLGMWQSAFPGYPVSIEEPGDLINNCAYYQMEPGGWIMDYPADEDWYDNLLTAHAGQNCTGTNVPQADQLVAQANVMADANAAEAVYQQAEQLYVNQVAWIVLDQPLDSYVMRKNVVGYAENGVGYVPPAVLVSVYIAG